MNAQRVSIAALVLLSLALGWAAVYFGRDEIRGLLGQDAPAAASAAGSTGDQDGSPDLVVSEAVQKASGIESREPEAHELRPALPLQGVVMDLVPLAELRGRLLAATRDAEALRAAALRGAEEYRRVRALYEDDRNASERALQAADAERRAAEARLAAAEAGAAALREQLRLAWGSTVARWAEAGSPELAALLQGREVLLLMTLPLGEAAPKAVGAVEFAAPGMARPGRASFVSPAPRADPAHPGAGYLFRAPAAGLRAGDRLTGRLPTGARGAAGVIVPAEAVVWHGGKAWVYVQESGTRFERREVSTAQPAGSGWFDPILDPESRIVVRGAQLLLSQEFRGQITNENED